MKQLGQEFGEELMRREGENPQDLPGQKSVLALENLELKTKRLGLGVPPDGEEIHMGELQRQKRSLVNSWLSNYSEDDILPGM